MRLRMWKILAAASDFQRCVDRNQLFKWEEIRERHKASGYGEAFTSKVQKHMNTKDAPDELLKAMWKAVIPKWSSQTGLAGILKKNLQSLYGSAESSGVFPDSVYSQNRADFERLTRTGIFRKSSCLCIGFTHISAVLFTTAKIFRKGKNGCGLYLLIHELDMGAYLKNGRVFCLEDQIDICYRFSRELEHSDLNLNAFEDLLASDKLFALENMLKIC